MATQAKITSRAISGRPSLVALIAVSGFAVVIFAFYGLDLPLRRDNAQYIYTAQRLLLGEMPYQSLFDMKTPLTSIVTAGFLLLSRPFFDEPLVGVRLLYFLMTGATMVMNFIFVRRLLNSTYETWLAPVMILGFHGFLLQTAIGAEPKLLMLFLFHAGLLLLLEKRWFVLGVIGALCSFTWQPSGVLFLASLVYAGLQPGNERYRSLSHLVVGFLVPSFIIFGAFFLTGALKDLLQGSFLLHFYLSRPNDNEILIMSKMLPFGFPFSFPIILVALAAFLIHGIRQVAGNSRLPWADNPYVPLLIIMVLFGLACLLDFQSYPDFFALLPFSTLGIVVIYRAVRSYLERSRPSSTLPDAWRIGFFSILAIVPLLNAAFPSLFSDHAAIWRGALSEQRRAYDGIVRGAIGDYDANSRVIIIGVPEIPALLGFRNATQHVSLGSVQGYDAFIASNYANGLAGWLEEMSSTSPELVIVKMSDLAGYTEEHRQQFLRWLNNGFTLVSTNPEIQSHKFRSEMIETWVPKTPGVS